MGWFAERRADVGGSRTELLDTFLKLGYLSPESLKKLKSLRLLNLTYCDQLSQEALSELQQAIGDRTHDRPPAGRRTAAAGVMDHVTIRSQ